MEADLLALQTQVDILNTTALPSTGKRPRTNKTDRLKAIVAIHEMLGKKNIIKALTASSTFEMVRGPPEFDSPNSLYLGWAGLTTALLFTLTEACDEALTTKTARSANTTIKPDFMKCFRRAINHARKHAPSGAIRSIIPTFLLFAHDKLCEPAIRNILADEIWQCVHDLMQDHANRAMLTPPFIRIWVDDCFQQLTGRGPMKHASHVATALAAEVLQLLATNVESYDVLTQSTKGMTPSRMRGGDFGYAIICQRSCLMLEIARSMHTRQARDLQQAAFRALTIALSDHALDVCESNALDSIIHCSLNPILNCWKDRKYHDSAVSLARVLLLIAPNHKILSDGIRRRVRIDVTAVNTSALVRTGQDIKDDYIDTVAACFSFRETLEFAAATDALQGHIIIWLRVAASIMSCRVLKRGISAVIDTSDLFNQCNDAAEAVTHIITAQSKSRGNYFAEIVQWACQVINVAASTANRIFLAGYILDSFDRSAWGTLYRTMRELLTTMTYSGRTPGYSRSTSGSNPDEDILATISLLSGLVLVDAIWLEFPSRTSPVHGMDLPFPLSRILSPKKNATPLDVEIFRNLVARNGFADEDGTGMRYRLVHSLVALCADNDTSTSFSPQLLINSSATALGLARGECGLSEVDTALKKSTLSPLGWSFSSLFKAQLFFGLSAGAKKIPGHGGMLAERIRDQDILWGSFPSSTPLFDKASHAVIGAFDPAENQNTGSLLSLSRHFAVDANQSEKLEFEILSQLEDVVSDIIDSPREESDQFERDERGLLNHSQRFADATCAERGLKVLIFACNYLLGGLHLGLIPTSNGAEDRPSGNMVSLIKKLLSCFCNSDVELVGQLSNLAMVCIKLSCQFSRKIEEEGRRVNWECNSPWKLASSAIPDMLTNLASKLSDFFITKLIALLRSCQKKIDVYAVDQLDFPTNLPNQAVGIKRKRGAPSGRSNKRSRMISSSESSRSHERGGFLGDSDIENEKNSDTSKQRGSDSDDLFWGQSVQLNKGQNRSSALSSGELQDKDQSREVSAFSNILAMFVDELPLVREVVMESCSKGLNALDDIERLFSPDGFERASLFSSLVDPSCIRTRVCVWNILFSTRSVPSLLATGKDILKVGRYWHTLEQTSQKYAIFHVDEDSSRRKQYPLPLDLEAFRIAFLDNARRFMELVHISALNHCTEYNTHAEEIRRILKGMIDISEHFRTQHAFRMPRSTRLAYLKFGQVVMQLDKGILSNASEVVDDTHTSVLGKVEKIQAALCKFLGDSEAAVRYTAAKVVPNVFASWNKFPMAKVERIFEENLPSIDVCSDSNVSYDRDLCANQSDDDDMVDSENPWNLREEEVKASSLLEESFEKLGATSKGFSTLAALGEIGALREDMLPSFFVQMTTRAHEKSRFVLCAYFVILRLCVVFGQKSPRLLYRAFSRAILPRLFGPPLSADAIYSFPAALCLDEDHHRDGAIFDWLRTEQSALLPHLLAHEQAPSLDLSRKFADSLGLELMELLQNNVGSFAVLFPMQFTPGLHERGQKLWMAIDEALGGKAISMLAKKKNEVTTALLLSASGNFVCRHAAKDRAFDFFREKGFSRDTRLLCPPFYDPLIIASAINHMYSSTSDAALLPKSVLRGSMFAELRDEQNGDLMVDKYYGFVKECARSNTTLLRCLVTISKALDPSLTCQSSYSRLDAYFGVAVLWMMLGSNILVKPTNERLIFYKLLARGFEHVETACDAAWMLFTVQENVFDLTKKHKQFSLSDNDMSMRTVDREHLTTLETSEERQMYELISTICPTLISVIANHATHSKSVLRDTAHASLQHLLSFCASKQLHRVIVCNGAFPGGKHFKEAKNVYQSAIVHVEGAVTNNTVEKIFSSLRRFRGVYRLREKLHSSITSLACLQELRSLLVDANVTNLSRKIESEAWVRSNGDARPIADLISSSIASLVELLRSAGHKLGNVVGIRRRDTDPRPYSSWAAVDGSSSVRLEEQVLRAVADVLNTLGLVHQHSTPFIHVDSHRRSIPARHINGRYEGISDGIFHCLYWLVDVLRSDSSVASESAMNAIVAVLRTVDGKAAFSAQNDLGAMSSFIDRKVSSSSPFGLAAVIHDPRSGDGVLLSSLPQFNDPQLWNISAAAMKEDGTCEEWLRRLCAVLSTKCRSTANQALGGACFSSFHLSCDVLPYLLMDIVCDLDPTTIISFSNLIMTQVLKKAETPSSILRILVHALNVLCQIGQSVYYESGVGAWVLKTSTGCLTIPYLYVLDIPYSEAAQAALRCGESFSAIRYSQLYVDHKVMDKEMNRSKKSVQPQSDRRYSSCPGRDPSIEDIERRACEKAKPWIREAMMQISEMDGYRAFAHNDSLVESALSVSNLDGEWFRSLASLGVAAHADSYVAKESVESSAGGIETQNCGVDLHREHDTLRSLLGIGNLNLASHYWDGLMNGVMREGLREVKDASLTNKAMVEKMNDLRYAAAWKLEHWESPPLISTKLVSDKLCNGQSMRTVGFHRAIYRVLHFYRTDRLSEIPGVLTKARSDVLGGLCEDNSVISALRICEAAAQLRVFNVIEFAKPGVAVSSSHAASSSGWSSRSFPQNSRAVPSYLLPDDSMDLPSVAGNGISQLSDDVDLVLGSNFGIDDSSSNELIPSRDAFNGEILAEDLLVVLMRCLGHEKYVARAAATVSARVLSKGDSSAWARSAFSLGTAASSSLAKASQIDAIAWKLQECRLRWTASDDARSRKQALNAVKDVIFSELRGKLEERTGRVGSSESMMPSLSWEPGENDAWGLAFLRSEACRLAANWSFDMKTHEPMDLFETYLEPGLKAAEVARKQNLTGRAHFAMASFADVQIGNIDTYRKSRKYEQMVSSVKELEENINRLKNLKEERIRTSRAKPSRRRSRVSSEASGVTDKLSKDVDHFIASSSKQVRQDRARLEKLNETYKKWQVLACEHFAACLRDGTGYDLRAAFRMVAIWLDSGDMRNPITGALTGDLHEGSISGRSVRVPVGKLLPLAPQLFSRLNHSDKASFQKTLSSTIAEMAGNYPAYCLWQLLALTNATRTSGNEEKMASLYRGDTGKKDAAVEILDRLQPEHGETVLEMKKVADAYIALSEMSPRSKHGKKKIDISRTQLIRLGELKDVPVPTVALPMHASASCERLPHIMGFEKSAGVCDGLSKPLRIKCIGSDGVIYPQVVKGRDDLRGDAVMEQMFTIMNSLLEKDAEASRRSLHVRTYRIIPLSPFTGIMQFVRNTMQFKELLIVDGEKEGRGGKARGCLHERYRPNDWKNSKISGRAFKDMDEYKGNVPKRLRFLSIAWQMFQPVFHYFFLEQWPDASQWFEHQLNYSRSVAVMSIVGFILGLGDRHLSNILVDVHTGEVVHIDFGISFEQGKLLPTPEHMPFRLTRDIVDGFGIAGVEGVFRRSSEITLSVMRRNKDVLLTVMEVLLHDPMYKWALTPEEVLREQMDPGGSDRDLFEEEVSPSDSSLGIDGIAVQVKCTVSGSREAHRALNRISEKLDGLEGTERLSVEAHVARLVDEAQAFHVIASVFPGWSPWV